MARLGISVVGWYHSHPHSQADPSLRDMDSQMEYQLKLKGDGHIYQPCLGLILCEFAIRSKVLHAEVALLCHWDAVEHV